MNRTFLLIVLLPLLSFAENEGSRKLIGIWEGSSNPAGGIFFYDQLVINEDLSGVYICGSHDAVDNQFIGGTFSSHELKDRGGYYEVSFQGNPNTKLVFSYHLSSNSLQGWLFITDPKSGFTFSPFLKELYKTDGEGRADAILAVNERVNKLLKGDSSLRGSPSAHSTTQTSAP
ncbi:hypothetical protein [Agaribacterium sp. ZY112]|uniref:hypothetical protein n=1 Tax=Agaribacterium sp. ZY112 TaxID=3233574 RepID=UPI0035249FA0